MVSLRTIRLDSTRVHGVVAGLAGGVGAAVAQLVTTGTWRGAAVTALVTLLVFPVLAAAYTTIVSG